MQSQFQGTGMSRFRVGDTVIVLPKYRRLYANEGVVLRVKPDELNRNMFDRYLIESSSGFRYTIFDFRLASSNFSVKTIPATIVPPPPVLRIRGSVCQEILLQTSDLDIHLMASEYQHEFALLGQILQRNSAVFMPGIEVFLLQGTIRIGVQMTNDLGEFRFPSIPEGILTIEVVLRPNLSRVVGSFAVTRSDKA
jgi:hypothetical protein